MSMRLERQLCIKLWHTLQIILTPLLSMLMCVMLSCVLNAYTHEVLTTEYVRVFLRRPRSMSQ